jgi:DNA-binding response OmpR family regulator
MDNAPTDVKVLIVGNSKEKLKPIFAYLESMNIMPLSAESVKDAINIYRREQPDIVLMEKKIPEIDCFEFSREIRALDMRNNWTSIIFLTRITDEEGWPREIDA